MVDQFVGSRHSVDMMSAMWNTAMHVVTLLLPVVSVLSNVEHFNKILDLYFSIL